MTSPPFTPEVAVSETVARWLATRCTAPDVLPDLEHHALKGSLDDPFLRSEPWRHFAEQVHALWQQHDHVILRGIPEAGEGATLLLACRTLASRYKPYRADKVVKHFRMSPWTTDLSHTTREGHFHTDINTAPEPPRVTGIQCKVPDPGAPRYGELRVARLPDLLTRLRQQDATTTLAFLEDTQVTMVNETSPGGWTGPIVSGGLIRFHPETLRAGQRRHGNNPPDLETHLQAIHEAALAVSAPIHLEAGEVLLLSNTRTLHYRGACSVVFQQFPRVFTSREVYVLHMLDEPV